MWLVLIETSGNQDFIFGSNKLRQNVGGSELVWRIGDLARRLAEGKIRVEIDENGGAQEGSASALKLAGDPGKGGWWTQLRRSDGGPALLEVIGEFQKSVGGATCEVLVGISGKALIRVPDQTSAKLLIRAVTLWARLEAPGLDVHGISLMDDSRESDYQSLVNALHCEHFTLRSTLPAAEHRFVRRPCIADCATTSYPASVRTLLGSSDLQPASAMALAKARAAKAGINRLSRSALVEGLQMASSIDQLDQLEEVERLAVIHADGNGLGKIFLAFQKHAGARDAADYGQKLAQFSDRLDGVTQRAFVEALRVAKRDWQRLRRNGGAGHPHGFLPVVPLVLGGDDLTIVCDGELAIPLTIAYLQAFERLSAADECLSQIMSQTGGRLSASAGVAIVNPHFPFHAAYELSESLLRRAKQVKQKCSGPASAFDFHVLKDSSGSDLSRIEAQLTNPAGAESPSLIPKSTRLYHRPVVVTPLEELPGLTDAEQDWVCSRHVGHLGRAVGALLQREEDDEQRRRIPNSLAHDLRASLFLGKDQSDGRLQAAKRTWSQGRFFDAFAPFLEKGVTADEASLFFDDDGSWSTRFLDAMDIASFWSGGIEEPMAVAASGSA